MDTTKSDAAACGSSPAPGCSARNIPGGIRYIRHTYGVPAKRGMRITWHHAYAPHMGTVVGARYGNLRVKLDGIKRVVILHPTDNVEYHELFKPNPQVSRDGGKEDA
jgi:hypothetical protein